METSQEELAGSWLKETQIIARLLDKICESLLLLKSKRETLEEKMISSYLNTLAAEYGSLIRSIHVALAAGIPLSSSRLSEISDFNVGVEDAMDRLLKAARYDLNFLEQYFEYDFVAELTEQLRFVDRLQKLNSESS